MGIDENSNVNEQILPLDVQAQGENYVRDYKLLNGDEKTVWKLEEQTDEPPAPPPPPEKTEEKTEIKTTEPVTFDYSKFGVQNDDELLAIVNEHKTIKPEFERIKPEHEQTKAELEKLKKLPAPNFANENIARLNALYAKEPKEAEFYAKLLYGNSNNLDLHIADYIKNYPDSDIEVVEALIKDQYSEYFDPEADKESMEYRKAKMAFENEASKIKKSYYDEFGKIEIPKQKTPEQITEENELRKSNWEKAFTFEKDVEHLIQVDGDPDPFKYTIKGDELGKFKSEIVQFLTAIGADITEDNFKMAYATIINNRLKIALPTLLKEYSDNKVAIKIAEMKKQHNGIPDVNLDKGENSIVELDDQDKAMQKPRVNMREARF